MFRVALESERRADHDTSLLHARLAGALANAGRGAEAAAAYQRAIEGAFVAEALEYKRRAAEQLLRSGHVDDGLAAMRGVLAEVGMKLPGSPRQALLNVLRRRLWRRLVGLRYTRRDPSQISPEEIQRVETCWSVSAGLALVDTLCGMDFQTRYVSAALGTGNPQRIARALAVEAMYVSTGGRAARPRTDRLIAHAEQLAEASRDPGAMGLVHGAKGMTGFQQGEFRFAFDHAERALELLRNHCIGVTWEIDSAELIALWALYYLGELGELRRRVPALRLDAEERGDLFAVTSLSSGLPSAHLLAADEPDLAAREADEAVRRWGARGFHLQHYWHWLGRVQVELYRGDAAAALARIEDMWPRLGRAHLLGIQGIRFQSHDARVRARLLAVHTGVDDARAHLADVERSARVLDGDALAATRALARGFRAGLAAARGEGARAAAAYGEAVAAFEAAGMPLHAAGARYRQGVLLGGDGAAMVRDACAWLHARGAANPARFAALLAPGPAGAT
jgi:tetratricopeptide (TPR) repeat protein